MPYMSYTLNFSHAQNLNQYDDENEDNADDSKFDVVVEELDSN